MNDLTITQPDDWHLHLRDDAALRAVLPHTARQFARAIVMPNLKPPVRTLAEALAYRDRILAARPAGSAFEPLMTLYLTDNTSADEVLTAHRSGLVQAVKYYPAGATTNSDSGVTDIARCDAVFQAMQDCGMPLLLHGEVTGDAIDVFDREAVFIVRHLVPLMKRFPKLKIVLEHITTSQGAEFVASRADTIAATITPQHLLFSRNAIFKGGLNPHYYCLPVLKREEHRVALVKAATGGSGKFFLGTDSAPHAKNRKEACCGAAGCYSAFHALELYAQAFEAAGALDRLEGFASHHGADFYGLPRNRGTVTLKRESWTVPGHLPFPEGGLVPLMSGETLQWRLAAPAG
ncbi:MAG: dihydroorotase [Betaproteobacteria bacterium]|nr:dihydroorotase [Betaproteobacteria bacterium]